MRHTRFRFGALRTDGLSDYVAIWFGEEKDVGGFGDCSAVGLDNDLTAWDIGESHNWGSDDGAAIVGCDDLVIGIVVVSVRFVNRAVVMLALRVRVVSGMEELVAGAVVMFLELEGVEGTII